MLATVVVRPFVSWYVRRRVAAPWRPVALRAALSPRVMERVVPRVRITLVRLSYLALAAGAIIRLSVS